LVDYLLGTVTVTVNVLVLVIVIVGALVPVAARMAVDVFSVGCLSAREVILSTDRHSNIQRSLNSLTALSYIFQLELHFQ